MKITIYELLELIKEGKAPKKFKYDDNVFVYRKEANDYQYEFGNISFFKDYFNPIYDLEDFLDAINQKLEIIEEEKEIEKLNLDTDELRGKEIVRSIDYLLEGKINQLIDLINDMRDKE